MAFGDLVEAVSGNDEGTDSITLTLTGATAGNLLIFVHFTGNDNTNPPTNFTQAVAQNDSGNADDLGIHYKIATGGETSITATSDDTDDEQMGILAEFEGPFDATPLDVTASNGPTSETTTSTGTTGTTAQASELAIGAVSMRSLTNVSAWSNSYTEFGDQQSTLAKTVAAAYLVLTATGTAETTATHGSATSMGAIATFKAAGGGGGVSIGRGLTQGILLARPSLVGMPHRPLAGTVRPHLIGLDGRKLAA